MWQTTVDLLPPFVSTSLLIAFAYYVLIYDKVDYTIFYNSNGRLSRRLGYFETLFLSMGEVQNRGSVTTLLQVESTVKLNKDSLYNALLMVLKRFPLLRMHITKKHNNLYFEEMDDPQRLDFRAVDDIDADNWPEAFEKQVNGRLFDVEKGPLWRVLLLKETCNYNNPGQKYKNAIVFTFHHIIGDALAIFELKKKLLEYLDCIYHGREVQVKSLPFRPPVEVLMVHKIKPKILEIMNRKIKSVWSWFSANLESRNLYLSVFPPANDHALKRMTSMVAQSLDVQQTSTIVKCCKANKCSVNGAFTTATNLAMARLLLQNSENIKTPLTLSTIYTVNIRNECKPKIGSEEFGLFATANSLKLLIPSVQTGSKQFWDLARTCTNDVRESVKAGDHLNYLQRVQYVDIETLRLWNRNDVNHTLKPDLFLLMNLGSIQIKQDDNAPYKFAGAYLGVKSDNNGYIFRHAMFTVNGKIYWSMDYYPHLTTKKQAEEFLDLSLDMLLKACEENS